MNRKITPSQKLEQEIAELSTLRRETDNLLGELMRRGGEHLVQSLLEAEVTERLGRSPYERGGEPGAGHRNGYRDRTLATSEGELEIRVPQVRGTDETFRLKLWDSLRKRTDALERLVVEMYTRGLSTRDIEDTLGELSQTGDPMLSRSGVSRVTESIYEEYKTFTERDLSGHRVVYLFADAIYESLRLQGAGHGILVTWGVLEDGSKALIHISRGGKESETDWLDHFRSLVGRGLCEPLTLTSDGAPGLIKAVTGIWPDVTRIRCWAHKMRNLQTKVGTDDWSTVKPLIQNIRDAPTFRDGQERADMFIKSYENVYPSLSACLKNDLSASLAHLKLPEIHRKTVRTTNLLERSFEEERRRTKVLPRFFREKDCLKLVYGTLFRVSQRWNRIRFSAVELAYLQSFKEERRKDRALKESQKRAGVAA